MVVVCAMGVVMCAMGVDCVVLMDVIGLIGEVMFVIQGVYGVGVFNSIDYVMTS